MPQSMYSEDEMERIIRQFERAEDRFIEQINTLKEELEEARMECVDLQGQIADCTCRIRGPVG